MTQKIFAICGFGLVCLAATGCNQNSQLATDSQAASSATESGNSNNGSRVLDQFLAPCDLNKWDSFMTVSSPSLVNKARVKSRLSSSTVKIAALIASAG